MGGPRGTASLTLVAPFNYVASNHEKRGGKSSPTRNAFAGKLEPKTSASLIVISSSINRGMKVATVAAIDLNTYAEA